MKKLIITLAIALAACTAAFAQKGLSVGVGYQSYTLHQDYTITLPVLGDVTMKSDNAFGGVYAGASFQLLSFGPGINFIPGLYYSATSWKDSDDADVQAKQSFVGIPMYFSYKLDLVPGTLAIEPFLGPTFSYGLTFKGTGDNWTNTTDYYSGDYKYNKFNVALGGGIALDIVDMIRVNVGYNYYLLNLYGGDGQGNVNRNGALSFGVAYMF